MSRTLEQFSQEDLGLYFNGTFVVRLKEQDVGRIHGPDTNEEGQFVLVVATPNKRGWELPENLCQWWPETRGYNINFGGRWYGIYLQRNARRMTRRSVSRDALVLTSPGGGRWVFDENVAQECFTQQNYVPPLLTSLRVRLEEFGGTRSVAVGRRLIYVPHKRTRPMTGVLHYGAMGPIGALDIEARKYVSLCSGTRLEKRAAYSIDLLMRDEA